MNLEDTVCKVCIDISLQPDQIEAGASASIKENPANLLLMPPQNLNFRDVGVMPPSRMAVLTGKRWATGRTF